MLNNNPHMGIRCPKCKTIIFSEGVHDFVSCPCKSVFVDGGYDYLRYGSLKAGIELDDIEKVEEPT